MVEIANNLLWWHFDGLSGSFFFRCLLLWFNWIFLLLWLIIIMLICANVAQFYYRIPSFFAISTICNQQAASQSFSTYFTRIVHFSLEHVYLSFYFSTFKHMLSQRETALIQSVVVFVFCNDSQWESNNSNFPIATSFDL